MSVQYTLQVVRLEGLQRKRRFSWLPSRFYVVVRFEDDTRKTRTIKKTNELVWDEPFTFSSSDESTIFNIQVKRKSLWGSAVCIGHADISLADLKKKCADEEASLRLSLPSGRTSTVPAKSITLRLESGDPFTNTEDMLNKTDQGVQQSGIAHSDGVADTAGTINNLSGEADSGSELYKAMKELLSRLGAFKNVIDALSEIHPFLTLAWGVTSGLLKMVEHVFETDAKAVALVNSMREAFTFISDLETLRDKVRTLQEPIIGLLKQTVECCTFIREYISRGFVERMFDISSSTKIDEFKESLANFKARVETGATIHTAVVLLRTSDRIDTLYLQHVLRPSPTDTFDRPVCLAGTRLGVQEQILEWIFSDTKRNVLWLHGVAGSGKSTVCTTIAHHLRRVSRLGAYLFFERGKSEPSTVIRTLAYELASFDSSIASSILSAIDRDKKIVDASPADQFNALLLEPLVAAENTLPGPIVIALDALDQCGTPDTRRSLMQLLKRAFPVLPTTVRFMITSRQEHDIETMFSSISKSSQTMDLDYTSPASRDDVSLYFRTEMDRVVRERVNVPADWPWKESIALLSKTAGGLFIWASTAVKLVSESDNPFGLFKKLVSDSRSLNNFGLGELYATVLRDSGIVWSDSSSKTRFEQVVGILLLSKTSLTSEVMDEILGFPPGEPSALVLSNLRCLLKYSPGEPVSLFHASLADYLLSPERVNDPWFINVPTQQTFITTRCFSIMNKMLHFNMCQLSTSFVRNDGIPDLQVRIEKYIPSHLNYACVHWSRHLCEESHSSDSDLLEKLYNFAHGQLLFWFEVLSLTGQFRLASPALHDASSWAANRAPGLSSFLTEASKLAAEFTFPIAQSTSHIYISMIALTKIDSEVSAHYSNRMTSLIHVARRGIKRQARWLKVLEGHRKKVLSVTVSPDGKRFASASEDMTIRIWDSISREEALPPLTGHSSAVRTINFSPDGTRVISGSEDCTIRIWDAQDGNLIIGPLEQHSKTVLSATYSPDGMKIASASSDTTVLIWNALNGEVIAGPFEGHTDAVRSIAFSPDGTRLASGSDDKTIRIWYLDSGVPVLEPFTGHSDLITSIAFSPDGKYIASGSDDMTIRVWEVKCGSVHCGPLLGHTSSVMSVTYSPCGTRIASGSVDNTIRVWDAENGNTVSGPLEGHAGGVSSVAFSPDCTCVISGSHDSTVGIWAATPLESDITTFSGHKGPVTRVLFSTESRVASASLDGSIVIWNADSGQVVVGPCGNQSVPVNDIVFSSDISRLISGSDDRKVRIWDVESGKIVCMLEGHTDEVWCVAVSPDDTQIVSGCKDGTIRVWNTEDGTLYAEPPKAHSDAVRSIVFSRDGSRLASCSDDYTIRIWESKRWETISELLVDERKEVNSVCFSPNDEEQIASGADDDTIVLWKSGQVVGGPFCGHTGWVSSVIFSHDGKHLLSGSEDKMIRIWNIETGQAVCQPLEGHSSPVSSLALSPDGIRLASGSYDGTVRVWNLSNILERTAEENGDESDSVDNKSSVNWTWGENGWILGGRDRHEPLLWIPPDLRRTLWNPLNTAVFSCEFSTMLDFSGAAYGERWTECFSS